MMKKLFNKKTAKVYILILCLTLIAGVVSSGFCIYYSAQFDKILKEKSTDTSEVLTTVLSALSGDEESTNALTGMLSSALTSMVDGANGKEPEEEKLTDAEQAVYNNKILTLILLIVFYALCLVFSAGAIACYEYERYLLSPKYKAKLKRMQKYEKMKAK